VELAALYMTLGSLHLQSHNQLMVRFTAINAAISRRIIQLLRGVLNLTTNVHMVTSKRFGGRKQYVITLDQTESIKLLSRLSMLGIEPDGSYLVTAMYPKIRVNRSCCARSFLRGAMLGAGHVSSPDTGYHLDITAESKEFLAILSRCVKRFGLPVQQGKRKDMTLLFYTKADQIITLFTLMGAHQAVIHMEDKRIRREVIGKVNRAVNCDNANLKKQMKASERQMDQIRILMADESFQSIPPSLQEIAQVRLNAPYASLSELGLMLSPPIGKSGANHRMRKLMQYVGETE